MSRAERLACIERDDAEVPLSVQAERKLAAPC
jgi:hypothetical protein